MTCKICAGYGDCYQWVGGEGGDKTYELKTCHACLGSGKTQTQSYGTREVGAGLPASFERAIESMKIWFRKT